MEYNIKTDEKYIIITIENTIDGPVIAIGKTSATPAEIMHFIDQSSLTFEQKTKYNKDISKILI